MIPPAPDLPDGVYSREKRHDWLVRYVAADFDGRQGPIWQQDVARAVSFLRGEEAPLLINLSRSGEGAHVRILFREPVPAWMARTWLLDWLTEAGVIDEDHERAVPSAFDKVIPPQHALPLPSPNEEKRPIGNLIGAPLHAGLARKSGASLVLNPARVEAGDLNPDGRAWYHTEAAVDAAWGYAELKRAVDNAPRNEGHTYKPPRPRPFEVKFANDHRLLNTQYLDFTAGFCEFLAWCEANPHLVTYDLWVALAANLHAFGDAGYEVFDRISAEDLRRYNAADTLKKWQQTASLHPIRCDTLAALGWRCPYLDDTRCNGAVTPATLHLRTYHRPL
jgi:hypothetical protein